MTKLLIFLTLSFYSFGIIAQKSKNVSSNGINSCVGAVSIFENGQFDLQFTGKYSKDILKNYPSLTAIEKENQIWVSYIATSSGDLIIDANKETGFMQMIIFKEIKTEVCTEISAGTSEIERFIVKKENNKIGLNFKTGNGFLYPMHLQEGEKIVILFATEKKLQDHLILNWNFVSEQKMISETKIIDKRFDDFAPTFQVLVRDASSKEPLVATIAIQDSKTVDGIYTASDIFLNMERKYTIKITCDIEGYFFKDTLVKITPFDDQEVLFNLDRISKGKSIKIEDIEFKAGSSLITDASIPKLKRLKDFLLLNADINIEIQGHVFALGDNSVLGQKISEARAKRVRKYLIENGIDKHRLEAKGYGNTMPVFEEPKFSYEEQANRRVEILVL
ncbi:MAG TPA: OmpA family protein [Crocinitomicaceae bacterium]|nr:OmpA family protein [Crocinitomicaceae bacterium]